VLDQQDQRGDAAREAAEARRLAERVRQAIAQVMVGAAATIDLALVALLAEGHLLIEDVPGTGKTTLMKTLAAALGGAFSRIQCTPDLLPSDVTGFSFFNQQSQSFEFRAGPIFAQVVLVDEINRATPRTQAAFLEAMAEGQVSAEGSRRPLPRPFLLLATQNPIELEGTFPLPEAQLDRFLLRAPLGYPTREEELAIVRRFAGEPPVVGTEAVVDAEGIAQMQRACRGVFASDPVAGYAIDLVRATREQRGLTYGASPRAAVNLVRAARARALLAGRTYLLPDDVKALAVPVLAHRLVLSDDSRLRHLTAANVLEEIVAGIATPVEPVAPVAATTP
jgi:MoxR-like ATPase